MQPKQKQFTEPNINHRLKCKGKGKGKGKGKAYPRTCHEGPEGEERYNWRFFL